MVRVFLKYILLNSCAVCKLQFNSHIILYFHSADICAKLVYQIGSLLLSSYPWKYIQIYCFLYPGCLKNRTLIVLNMYDIVGV